MRRLACCALLALTACNSAQTEFVSTDPPKIVTPLFRPALPLGQDEVIWLMLRGGARKPGVLWFAVVRPLSDGTGEVEYGERDDPLGPLVRRNGALSAHDYMQLWEEVEGKDVWSLPGLPLSGLPTSDPYTLGVRCLVQRGGRAFHNLGGLWAYGCRGQRSTLAPSDGERERYVGLVDTVRAIAKKAATDVVPAKRSH